MCLSSIVSCSTLEAYDGGSVTVEVTVVGQPLFIIGIRETNSMQDRINCFMRRQTMHYFAHIRKGYSQPRPTDR